MSILQLSKINIGVVLEDWNPDDNWEQIDNSSLADEGQLELWLARTEKLIAFKFGADVALFSIEADDEAGDRTLEAVQNHLRAKLQGIPAFGLNEDRLSDVVNLITSDDLHNTLDGDEQEHGWHLETETYEASGESSNYGNLPCEDARYAGGFYLSVVRFTDQSRINDQEFLQIELDAGPNTFNVEVVQGISEIDHEYFVGVWKAGVDGEDNS
ncbi:MAG: hypothetical protein P4L83_24780 [Nevskia sp.]|nr:hypothetical protein [Nevskia sp.]